MTAEIVPLRCGFRVTAQTRDGALLSTTLPTRADAERFAEHVNMSAGQSCVPGAMYGVEMPSDSPLPDRVLP